MTHRGALLEVIDLKVHFGGLQALRGVTLSVREGEIVAIIGPNGAGKTTLFNAICGFVPIESGIVRINGREIRRNSPETVFKLGVARSFQEVRLSKTQSVMDNLLLSLHQQWDTMVASLLRFRINKEHEAREQCQRLVEELGLEGKIDNRVRELSFGQQKLVSLACVFLRGCPLSLLDEPVAGLAPHMIERVTRIVAQRVEQGHSFVLIEHRLDFVRSIAHRIVVLAEGQVVASGPPEEVLRQRKVVRAYLT